VRIDGVKSDGDVVRVTEDEHLGHDLFFSSARRPQCVQSQINGKTKVYSITQKRCPEARLRWLSVMPTKMEIWRVGLGEFCC
jgi:hypothetical protein